MLLFWFMECAVGNAVSKTIDDLKDRGGLKGVDVANITRVSKATVTRWSAGTHAPQPKTQLVLSDLRYVVDKRRPPPVARRAFLLGVA